MSYESIAIVTMVVDLEDLGRIQKGPEMSPIMSFSLFIDTPAETIVSEV